MLCPSVMECFKLNLLFPIVLTKKIDQIQPKKFSKLFAIIKIALGKRMYKLLSTFPLTL